MRTILIWTGLLALNRLPLSSSRQRGLDGLDSPRRPGRWMNPSLIFFCLSNLYRKTRDGCELFSFGRASLPSIGYPSDRAQPQPPGGLKPQGDLGGGRLLLIFFCFAYLFRKTRSNSRAILIWTGLRASGSERLRAAKATRATRATRAVDGTVPYFLLF